MRPSPYIEGKSLDELVNSLLGVAEVGSPVYEQIRAAIEVEVARLQARTASDAARWAKWQALGTMASAVVAVLALVVASL